MKYLGTDPRDVTEFDDDKLQANIAMLGFKVAAANDLAKYNLQDQIIDEYEDASGVDTGASTNEVLTAGVYAGEAVTSPTPTQDADATATDGDYTWYKWTDTGATGSYNTPTTQDHIWLVVAGGGGGCGGGNRADAGGGGGGGGVRYGTTLSLIGGNTYTITVGAGGAGSPSSTSGSAVASSGGDSSIAGTGITDITSNGGGGGKRSSGTAGSGGSGGAGGYNGTSGAGNTPAITQYTAAGETTTVQGFAAGNNGAYNNASGGGGASEVGGNGHGSSDAGDGGDGNTYDIDDGSKTYGGGGGGGAFYTGQAGAGGAGGGGAGGNGGYPSGDGAAGVAGTNGLGGGAGGRGGYNDGEHAGVAGGSGVVVLRRLTSITAGGADLTLQSLDTTASTANPDYADMVVLMENAEGTATLNTDIKGYVSEDSGVTFTQGTFVDEGSWGTDKKIIAFHDLDISAQSGSAMCYKITTHNQSLGSKETKIHATSIGWR